MSNLPTRLFDSIATLILFVALGTLAVAVFAYLVIALSWLVIPVLLVVGAIAWLIHRGKF